MAREPKYKGRITKRVVDAFECPPGRDRETRWDEGRGATTGFGVTAFPSGKKFYVAQWYFAGRQRRMAIGEHGHMTPDQAREEAKEYIRAGRKGLDPLEERRKLRGVRSFQDVADDYLRIHVKAKRKARTHESYSGLLKTHLYPVLGTRAITDISKQDVARLHGRLSERPGSANRCLSVFDAVWNWAIRRGEISNKPSPTAGIDLYPEKSRERFLTDDELRTLGTALRQAETTGVPWVITAKGSKAKHVPKNKRSHVIDSQAVAAIRLLMLTGARLREILTARWDYIDWNRGLLLLPDSKTGRKTIYLSDAALGVLSAIDHVKGNPYIIAGEKKGAPRADLKRPWAAISRRAGLNKADGQHQVRLHDLRHTFASYGVGSSLGLPIVGKLLGHSQASTTQRYAHLDADPLHKAANLIGSQIASALAGDAKDTKSPQITQPKPKKRKSP